MLFHFLPLNEGCSVSTAAFMLIQTRIEFLSSAKSVSTTKRAVFLSIGSEPQTSKTKGTALWRWVKQSRSWYCFLILENTREPAGGSWPTIHDFKRPIVGSGPRVTSSTCKSSATGYFGCPISEKMQLSLLSVAVLIILATSMSTSALTVIAARMFGSSVLTFSASRLCLVYIAGFRCSDGHSCRSHISARSVQAGLRKPSSHGSCIFSAACSCCRLLFLYWAPDSFDYFISPSLW